MKKGLTADETDANAQIQYDIAESYEFNKDFQTATVEYLKVTYIYPKSIFWCARAELKCAQILEDTKQWGQALRIYEKLAQRDVGESEIAKQRIEWLRNKKL